MQAEIIAIGDELSSGQRLDTNSQWLSQKLAELGISVCRHTTIGDNLASNVALMQESAGRSQITVITGGLGPTLDDLTRQSLAAAFELNLTEDAQSLQHIQQLFSRRGRPMPERNRIQAMFPAGAIVIPNPHGSAPGIDLTVDRCGNTCRFFALPGVPAEMKQMWAQTVANRIEQMQGQGGSLYYHSIKLFGLGESDVEARVPDLIARDRYPSVGITVSQATITLRIAARADSDVQFKQIIGPTVDEIEAKLGDIIFGIGEIDVQDSLRIALQQSGNSLAVVEVGNSCVAQAMYSSAREPATAMPPGLAQFGESVFRAGVSFDDVLSAKRWAGTALEPNSAEFWSQLALQAVQTFKSSIGMAIGVYPTENQIAQQPPGSTFPFWIAFAWTNRPELSSVCEYSLGGHPDVLNVRVAKTGMDHLRRQLAVITK